MAQQPAPSAPRRILRRAANLLTSNGQLQPVLQEQFADGNDQSVLSNRTRGGKLGASIKRRFKEVKDVSMNIARSKSLSAKLPSSLPTPGSGVTPDEESKWPSHRTDNTGAVPKRKGHTRSKSDAQATLRSTAVHSYSGPNGHHRSFSAQLDMQTLGHATESAAPAVTKFEPSVPIYTSPIEEEYEHSHLHDLGNLQPRYHDDEMSLEMLTDIAVPQLLQSGALIVKISEKNRKPKKLVFRVDPDQGQIIYESKSNRIIPIEAIKELRTSDDALSSLSLLQLSPTLCDRFITIIYTISSSYKNLHLLFPTRAICSLWYDTLKKLHTIRKELMSGLGNMKVREAIWERLYWKESDTGVGSGDGGGWRSPKTGGKGSGDGRLQWGEVERLCKRLNVSLGQDDLTRLFKQADVYNRGYLDFNDFRRFVKLLKKRPEAKRLYKDIIHQCHGHEGGVFDFAAFDYFMRKAQKSTYSTEELLRIFEKYSTFVQPNKEATVQFLPGSPTPAHYSALTSPPASDGIFSRSTTASPPLANPNGSPLSIMSLDSFTTFLMSPYNSAVVDQHTKIHHDMTRPLSEYYISSSHNTYLVGHQLVGSSTTEGYIRALLGGCRSVEIDIFDGDQEPMVFHGKTLTSKVSLREVCQAIDKYGFIASPYPIIISAEVHCSLAQQDLIASIMIEVFGDKLVRLPLEGRPKIDILPSPDDLKGRILLKTKNLLISHSESGDAEYVLVTSDPSTSSASDSDMAIKESKFEFANARNVLQRVRSRGKSPPVSTTTPGTTSTASLSPATLSPKSPIIPMARPSSSSGTVDRPKPKMSLALVALLVYTIGVKCRGINKKEVYAPEHLFSLSENSANKMLKQPSGMLDLIKHNRTHLVRIYPKGTRVNSTNYEPHRYWSAGAQLVAINWQTCDIGYMINHAMFQRNDRAGYVLKPPALRMPHKDLLLRRTKHFLDLTVISAQQLPRPKDASGREIVDKAIIDPFVEISLHVPDWTHSSFPAFTETGQEPVNGYTTDASVTAATSARTISHRTSVVKNNGFNPVWEEEIRLQFDCVGDMKELIFVRLIVRQEGKDDDGSEPLAIYCAPLGSLQPGYRHLPLHDAQLSQYLFSTLFVHISIRDDI